MSDRTWQYPFQQASGDYRTSRSMTSYGNLAECVGVDGRYVGGLRLFPGMKEIDLTDLSVANPVATATYAKYVELQRGTTGHIRRGMLIGVPAPDYAKFFWYDTGTASTGVTTLTLPGAVSDVTSRGRYLYVLCGTAGSRTFELADAGTLTTYNFGWVGALTSVSATMGSVTSDNVSDSGIHIPMETTYSDGAAKYGSRTEGTWWVGVRIGNLARNVWTQLSLVSVSYIAESDFDFTAAAQVPLRGRGIISGGFTVPAGAANQFDTVEIYRTISSGGDLIRCVQSTFGSTITAGAKTFKLGLNSAGSTAGLFAWDKMDDDILAALGDVYDFDLDDSGVESPTGDRIGLLGGVTFFRPVSTQASEIGETWWSRMDKRGSETFPAINVYRPPDLSSRIEVYVKAGTSMMGIGSDGVYRFRRSGVTMVIDELASGFGIVNRNAACEVGSDVAYVSPSGLVFLDGQTGNVTTVSALDRVLQEEWKDDGDYIALTYDSYLGALFVVNTSKREAMVVWGRTNTVTRLKGLNVAFVAQGPDPVAGGAKRAIFVTAHGHLIRPDASRNGFYGPNMRGIRLGPKNGTVTTANVGGTTTLTSTTKDKRGYGFFQGTGAATGNYVDALVYITSGLSKGLSAVITATPTDSTLTISPGIPLAVGDTYSIAPVIFEAVGWPMGSTEDPTAPRVMTDRRTLISVSANVVLHDDPIVTDNDGYYAYNFSATTNPNFVFTFEGYKRDNLTPSVTAAKVISEQPTSCKGATSVSDTVVLPGVQCYASGIDFTLLALGVYGNLAPTGDQR